MFDTKTITLTPAEASFAMSIATQRDACKKNRDFRYGDKMTGFGMHVVGVVGEVAFCKAYGGKIDQTVRPNGDNHREDVVLRDGREVEVKSTTWTGGDVHLKFSPDEIESLKNVCLVQVTLPDIAVVWPVWSREVIEPYMKTHDYGYGTRFIFEPETI